MIFFSFRPSCGLDHGIVNLRCGVNMRASQMQMLDCKSSLYQHHIFFHGLVRRALTTVTRALGNPSPSSQKLCSPMQQRHNSLFWKVGPISGIASSPQACQWQYAANWVNAAMHVFLKAVGTRRRRRRTRMDESPPLRHPPNPHPILCRSPPCLQRDTHPHLSKMASLRGVARR